MPDSAALPVSLTVLVLAWDEAAPAVTTLLEATPADTTHPLLVLLPPAPFAPAPAETTPKLATAPPEASSASSAAAPNAGGQPIREAPAATASEPTAPVTQTTTPPQPAAVVASVVSIGLVSEEIAPAGRSLFIRPTLASPAPVATVAPHAAPAPAGAPSPRLPAPVSPIRVLRLNYTAPLSGRHLTGSYHRPAFPYLGASEPAEALPLAASASKIIDYGELTPTQTGVEASPVSFGPELLKPTSSPAYFSEEEDTQAPDLEADLLPLTPEAAPPVLSTFTGLAGPGGLAPLPSEAEALAAEATLLPPDVPAGEPTDLGHSDELPAEAAETAVTVATQEAAPGLPAPASTTEAIEEAAPVASLPDAPTRVPMEAIAALAEYPAPDLNTQVIRYARYGVPAALAEQPFEVIYAPAWPTWLAAAELRQRTGRPLVLHLRALAADQQSADTAAGWPAEIQRQVLRQADLVLAETYALARRLRRELGLANGAVRVVPAADGAAVARALRRARRR